ncbi:hypothetical protein FJM05_01620 [Ureaplasma urealyticum]|uniref:Lipoprotein n=1 Tax=Ureaplasma urealyticum TaxID=2130 RepID=A0AAP9D7G0_UREUR|nr:hypothetical protein [Ureaplasma urealyticum]QDI64890.1 hypothetical protein FJM05_01620 [Ureaplasma urealyticum]
MFKQKNKKIYALFGFGIVGILSVSILSSCQKTNKNNHNSKQELVQLNYKKQPNNKNDENLITKPEDKKDSGKEKNDNPSSSKVVQTSKPDSKKSPEITNHLKNDQIKNNHKLTTPTSTKPFLFKIKDQDVGVPKNKQLIELDISKVDLNHYGFVSFANNSEIKLKLEFDVKLKNQETKQEPTIFEMPLYEEEVREKKINLKLEALEKDATYKLKKASIIDAKNQEHLINANELSDLEFSTKNDELSLKKIEYLIQSFGYSIKLFFDKLDLFDRDNNPSIVIKLRKKNDAKTIITICSNHQKDNLTVIHGEKTIVLTAKQLANDAEYKIVSIMINDIDLTNQLTNKKILTKEMGPPNEPII